MESLDTKKYEISLGGDKEYEIPKWKYYLIKFFFCCVGVFITVLLYHKCLFNPNCNTVVTIYLALLGLACFSDVGLPIDKLLANVKLN